MLELCNPRSSPPNPDHQDSGSRASVVVGQGAPFTRNALFVTQYHHPHYYRCEHGGLRLTLPSARVDHGTLQRPLVQVRTSAPHQCLELRAVRLTLLHLEQEILGQTVLIESDNMATVSYISKQGGVVFKTLND